MCLLLLSAGIGAGIFLKVSEVKVEGASEYTADDVVKASSIEIGDSLMLVNENETVLNIRGNLPLVKDIRLERHLPGKVKIIITENKAIAYVKDDSAYWAIDANGKILRKMSMPPLNLMMIKGIVPVTPAEGEKLSLGEGKIYDLAALIDFLTAAENQKAYTVITDVDMTDSGNIKFTYMGRFTVNFGRGENSDSKLKLVIGSASELKEDDTGTINLVSDTETRFVPGQPAE